jgi:biotin carboxyl carrier protein
VADELLPPLVARLGVSDLGEIEVRQGSWRVRIRRAALPAEGAAAPTAAVAGHAPVSASGTATALMPASHVPLPAPSDHPAAISTAVGYFGIRSGLAVGHRVMRGDVIGWVDVLGVRQEIVSPADAVVGRFVTEPGDPVEYGQELVSFIAATGAPPANAPDAVDTGTPDSTTGPA